MGRKSLTAAKANRRTFTREFKEQAGQCYGLKLCGTSRTVFALSPQNYPNSQELNNISFGDGRLEVVLPIESKKMVVRILERESRKEVGELDEALEEVLRAVVRRRTAVNFAQIEETCDRS